MHVISPHSTQTIEDEAGPQQPNSIGLAHKKPTEIAYPYAAPQALHSMQNLRGHSGREINSLRPIMSTTRVGISHRTDLTQDRPPRNSGSLLEQQFMQRTYPRTDCLTDLETIMRAAMDLDDYDH